MPELDYQKQAQDYYSRAPAIILGSGASAAMGISGMTALAAHLIAQINVSDLGSEDQATWAQLSALLASGIDLETALHRVSVSELLTSRIIRATWDLINPEDLDVFRRSLQNRSYFALGKLLSHMFRTSLQTVDIITTNYDRLAEYACDQEKLHHYSGFTHGFSRQLAEPHELKCARKVNIWKVHGSLDWFQTPRDEIVGLANVNSIPDYFEPKIITPGTKKYQQTHLEPFRSIINSSDRAINSANSYLCIGYGFNDEHIQPKLIVKCIRQSAPITVITYRISESAKKVVFENKAKNYLAIERGRHDDESIVYSSLSPDPLVINKNIWSLEGYLSIIL